MRSRRLLCGLGAAVLTAASGGWLSAQSVSTPAYAMLLTPSRALALVQAADRHLEYVPGEVLVKFRDGVGSVGQQRALMALRSRPVVNDLRWIGPVALLRDTLETDATILAAQLSAQAEVEYAEPNYLRHFNRVPNDPGFDAHQWNLTAIDMQRAWDINPGGSAKVTVAVVDTGVTTVNQSFTFRTWNGRATENTSVPFAVNPDLSADRLVKPKDLVFWTGPVLDMVGHGTHVSSTIGENTNNSLAEAGVAYVVNIMPVKVCVGRWEVQFVLSTSGFRGFVPPDAGGCDDAAVAQGIRYAADNGAQVINLSLGGPLPSVTERDALSYAVSKGAFVSIAAGNAFEDGNPTEYPAANAAAIDGAMAVGAVGPSLARAFYSNTGGYVEIVAPGGNHREGGASGAIWQATIFGPDSDGTQTLFPRFDRYAETPEEGTSMAAPHVAGTAALVISQGITKPAAVEALIKKTARDLGPKGRDDEYGFGLVQPRAALFGFGVAR